MLFKVSWEDLRKAVTADSIQGTLVCTAEYQGAGTSLSIFALVSGNFTGFYTHTEWMSPPCLGWGGGGGGGGGRVKWLVHYLKHVYSTLYLKYKGVNAWTNDWCLSCEKHCLFRSLYLIETLPVPHVTPTPPSLPSPLWLFSHLLIHLLKLRHTWWT